jgi:hypothetical protein
MTPAILHKQIRIKASAAQVWPYIGTQEGLPVVGTDISMEAKVGGACEERIRAVTRKNGRIALTGAVCRRAIEPRNPAQPRYRRRTGEPPAASYLSPWQEV